MSALPSYHNLRLRCCRCLLLLAAVLSGCLPSWGQEVSGYGYLDLPVSARVGALGGTSISVVEPELALADQNPALLCPEMAGQIALSYTNYMAGIHLGYGAYVGTLPREGAWSAALRYIDYGSFRGYDALGGRTGDFSVRDMSFQGAVAYPLGEKWHAGAQLKFLYSNYEQYSAFAVAVDAGLNYYNEVTGVSMSATLNNIGGQLKALYDGRRQSLPTQLNVGFSKELEHLPFCLSMTGYRLLDWDHAYVDGAGKEHSFSGGEMVLNHLIFGMEWTASDFFYMAAAYNYRNQRRFQGQGGLLRGVSFGAGVKYRQFNVQCSYASYNAADGSLMLQLTYSAGN